MFYLHWNEKEAKERARPLKAAGHKTATHWNSAEKLDWAMTPEVMVISLDRLPSHGKAVAAVFWEAQGRRNIPIIFAGGVPEKVAGTKAKFPDAIHCSANDIVATIDHVLASPPPKLPPKLKRLPPQTPGYSGKPLAVKLGLAEDQRIYFGNAPNEMDEWVGPLPPNAKRISKAAEPIHLAVLFGMTVKELMKDFKTVSKLMAPKGILWMAWPKKAAKIQTDVTEDVVREIGLASEWVDVKVCAISGIWSGLKFLRRRKDGKRG